jgi:hypothetical protein
MMNEKNHARAWLGYFLDVWHYLFPIWSCFFSGTNILFIVFLLCRYPGSDGLLRT